MAVRIKDMGLDEFLELPEEKPALEYEHGKITRKVSPKGKHSRLQRDLVVVIERFAHPARVAEAFPELRTTFGGRSCVPDVSVYRWSRRPFDPSGEIADDFTEPPDVVVEIVSPQQSRRVLVRRCLWEQTAWRGCVAPTQRSGRWQRRRPPCNADILVPCSGIPTTNLALRWPSPLTFS